MKNPLRRLTLPEGILLIRIYYAYEAPKIIRFLCVVLRHKATICRGGAPAPPARVRLAVAG